MIQNGVSKSAEEWDTALAQLPTDGISGTIRDSAAAIPSATVTATNRETGLARSVQSSGEGYYKFAVLPIGLYDVKSEAVSFSPNRDFDPSFFHR